MLCVYLRLGKQAKKEEKKRVENEKWENRTDDDADDDDDHDDDVDGGRRSRVNAQVLSISTLNYQKNTLLLLNCVWVGVFFFSAAYSIFLSFISISSTHSTGTGALQLFSRIPFLLILLLPSDQQWFRKQSLYQIAVLLLSIYFNKIAYGAESDEKTEKNEIKL